MDNRLFLAELVKFDNGLDHNFAKRAKVENRFLLDKMSLLEIYSDRREMLAITDSNELLKSVEFLLSNLRSSTSAEISLSTIVHFSKYYYAYSDPESKKVLGLIYRKKI